MTMATTVARTDAARLWPVGLVLVLPLLGLAVLLVQPELDMAWEHHPSHFWIVLVAAAVNVVLAYVTNIAAGRYRDARLTLISLAFLSTAGFLGLHALVTPGCPAGQPERRVRDRNAGRADHRVGVRGRVGYAARRAARHGRPPRPDRSCSAASSC